MWVFKSKNAPFYAYTYWKKMKRRSTYHSLPHHTVLNSLHFLLFSRRSLFTPIFHRISALRLTSEWVLLTLFFLNLKTALQWQLISLLQMNLFFFLVYFFLNRCHETPFICLLFRFISVLRWCSNSLFFCLCQSYFRQRSNQQKLLSLCFKNSFYTVFSMVFSLIIFLIMNFQEIQIDFQQIDFFFSFYIINFIPNIQYFNA